MLVALAIATAGVAASNAAGAAPQYAVVIVDADTGRVILSDSPTAQTHPASLTKMMTLYLTFDAIKAGSLSLDQRITVSAEAASRPPTKLGIGAGKTIAVKDAIMALITLSANDMSVALAEAIAGSEGAFARRMTSRARELGMSATVFRNANGLPDPGQVTNAADMTRLGLALMRDHADYYPYFATVDWRYGGKVIRNHNRMLGRYEGTNGIKTGYIKASGFNLVVSVERDGHHLVGAIFGGSSARARDDHMIELLDAAFARIEARPEMLVAGGETIRPNAVQAPKPIAVAAARPAAPAPAPPAPADVALAAAALDAKIAEVDSSAEDESEIAYAAPPAAPMTRPAAAVPAPVATPAATAVPAPVAAAPAAPAPRPAAPAAVAAAKPAPAKPAPAKPAPGTLEAQVAEAHQRATAGETWGVQIGAFRRQDAAIDHLNDAAKIAPSMLNAARMAVHQGTDDKGTIYRARFVGLTETSARQACLKLREKSVSCIALKVPSTVAASAMAGTTN
ncbi:D-alanyl-D-alanine carboxypeptidase family protein [Oleomonas cavernae]|uniref:D-alanyl-D-alanine carboxypeptidase family protein n=1 Tax=Oleomonas cavernae TaxID=2320859 RepID=UPI0013147490|nr:D-alanyl-D-alanine carboxypeptidase family protein [Oleomonas cavernae]